MNTKTPDEVLCGTQSKYTYWGCRCKVCRDANALRQSLMQFRTPPEHGTESSYRNFGCRCQKCKEAGSRANKRYREARLRRNAK